MAGLGNPRHEYAQTRHNVGFAVVERLATADSAAFVEAARESQMARIHVGSVPVALLKPQTFMNRSGTAVAAWLSRLDLTPAALVVVHDDLDLPVGRLRIVASAGAGGHRGVVSIQEALGTADFARVRLGIGRPEAGEEARERVLAEVSAEEATVLADAVARTGFFPPA